jgi:hypothetical protein
MKKHLIPVITLGLGLLGLALAAFDVRLSELKQEIKNEPGVTEEDARALTNIYEEYIKVRNDSMNAMLEMMRRTDSKQAGNYRVRTLAIFDSMGAKSSPKERLGKNAYRLYSSFLFDEVGFVTRIQTSELPNRRDEIVALNANLMDYTAKLDEKWKALNSSDQAYDEQQRAIARELRGIVEEIIKDVAESNKNLTERFGQVASLGSDFIPVVGKVVEKTVEKLVERQNYALKRMNDYRRIVDYEKNGIFVVFDDIHRETKKFIEENGFDRAKALYAKARDEANELASKGPAGVRADAKEFADQMLKILSDHLAGMENTFNRFVVNHKGKFFGPVAPELEEALVETRSWEQETNDVKRLGLEGKLREWRSNTPLFLDEIDRATNLKPETRKVIKDAVKNNIEALVRALEGTEQALSDRFWIVNYDRSELARQIKNGKN